MPASNLRWSMELHVDCCDGNGRLRCFGREGNWKEGVRGCIWPACQMNGQHNSRAVKSVYQLRNWREICKNNNLEVRFHVRFSSSHSPVGSVDVPREYALILTSVPSSLVDCVAVPRPRKRTSGRTCFVHILPKLERKTLLQKYRRSKDDALRDSVDASWTHSTTLQIWGSYILALHDFSWFHCCSVDVAVSI